jgi:hypothetical protein
MKHENVERCESLIDGTNLSILLYADDIPILAPNESNLQCMLNCVNEWCNKWSLSIICSKSNISN